MKREKRERPEFLFTVLIVLAVTAVVIALYVLILRYFLW
jgi:hypothetical protein